MNSFVRSLHLSGPNLLSSRENGSAPHPHLLTQPGSRCSHCRYTTMSRNLLQCHTGTSYKRQGYKSENHERYRIMLQCWTASGRRSYWEVTPTVPTTTSGETAQVSPSHLTFPSVTLWCESEGHIVWAPFFPFRACHHMCCQSLEEGTSTAHRRKHPLSGNIDPRSECSQPSQSVSRIFLQVRRCGHHQGDPIS